MKTMRKRGFKISRSGIAKQLVINTHGGWVESDGYTRVPEGSYLYFYTKHGDFTLGYKVVEAVTANSREARVGLRRLVSFDREWEITVKVGSKIQQKREELHKGLGIPLDELDEVINAEPHAFEANLQELVAAHEIPPYAIVDMRNNLNMKKTLADELEKEKEAICGVHDRFGGGNLMYDYALSKEADPDRKRICDELFRRHERGQNNPDVDLLQMTAGRTMHLSDVFGIIDGLGYEYIHFGACRVPYGDNPAAVTE